MGISRFTLTTCKTLFGCLTAVTLLSAMPVQAELNETLQQQTPPLLAAASAVYHQLPASLNRGGRISATSALVDVTSNIALSEKLGAGIHLAYDYTNYRFTGPVNLAGPKPWGNIQRLELGTNISYDFTQKLTVSVMPSLQFNREENAGWGNALAYGGVTTVSYDFTPQLTLGAGVAAFYSLKDIDLFPVITVKWQITDKLLLGNPLRPGPTGPAGIELSYTPVQGFDVALGAVYRSSRFRLGNSGFVKEGIGESNGELAFSRLTLKLTRNVAIDLFAGAVVGGELYVDDRNGNRLSSDRYNPAPFGALVLSGSF